MTRVKPGQRKRAKVAKVRTGCVTCKIRRVKCDEAKPSCRRCTSTGRKCDGYEQIAHATNGGRNRTPDSSTSDFSLDAVLCNPSTSISKCSREQRSFQFFLERTVTQFTTFFPSNLWTEIVLQVAYCEPSIRHAVFALSAFHEHFLEEHGGINKGGSVEDTAEGSFALSQYNLAIRKLVDPQSPVSEISLQAKVVNLISCLMFFGIETLRGKHYNAIQLFKYGHKIMREFHCGRELDDEVAPLRFALSNAKTLLTDLESYFLRLGITVLQLVGDVDPIMPLLAIPGFEERGPSIDGPFNSIREARDSFERLALGYMGAFPRSQIEHISYARKFTRWSRAFLDYKESRSELARRMEHHGTSLLELHMLHFETSLMMYTLPKEKWTPYAWDDNTRTFERMVQLAADAVGFDLANSGSCIPMAPKASFCLDVGVAGVMFSVTSLCRDSRIRRNAIRVLRHSNMQEGVWNSQLTAHVAERIVHMEEKGLGKITTSRDVPLERRITGCCVFFDPHEKRATIRYGLEEDSPKESLVW